MWKYIVLIAFTIVVWLTLAQTAYAAQQCYGYGATTHENPMASGGRHGQQYTHQNAVDLISVTMNVSGNSGSTGFMHFQIHETTAGLPTAVIVPGSVVQIATNTVPDRAIGTAQEFDCAALPPTTTFTFASPLTLVPGDVYAFTVYNTTSGQNSQIGFVSGNYPGIAAGSGLSCTGGGCATHTGWQLNTHGGFNYDNVYSLENDLAETGAGVGADIDAKIFNFRNWLQLGGDAGGLVFTVGVVAIIFIFGLGFRIPFFILGAVSTMLVAAFARSKIIEPWIVLAVVAIGGLALVFTVISRGGGSENEG